MCGISRVAGCGGGWGRDSFGSMSGGPPARALECARPTPNGSRIPCGTPADQGLGIGSPKSNNEPITKDTNPRHGKERKDRSEEHTSELQSRFELVCRLLLEKKKTAIE